MPIAGLIDGIVDSQRISADGSFISASTVLHCSGWVGDKQQQQQKKKKMPAVRHTWAVRELHYQCSRLNYDYKTAVLLEYSTVLCF